MSKVYSDFDLRRAKDKVSQKDVSEPQRAETPNGEQKPPARAAESYAVEGSKRRPEHQGYYVTDDSVLSQSCTCGNAQLSNFKTVSKTAVADEAAGATVMRPAIQPRSRKMESGLLMKKMNKTWPWIYYCWLIHQAFVSAYYRDLNIKLIIVRTLKANAAIEQMIAWSPIDLLYKMNKIGGMPHISSSI